MDVDAPPPNGLETVARLAHAGRGARLGEGALAGAGVGVMLCGVVLAALGAVCAATILGPSMLAGGVIGIAVAGAVAGLLAYWLRA